MASSFQSRKIRITFQLAAGTFNKDGNPDTVVFEDYRTRAEIHAPGGYEFSACRLRIYGIAKETMDRLTVINYTNLDFLRNVVTVEATDNNGQFAKIFVGEVYQATPDYLGAPEVAFMVEARAGLIGSLAPSVASSYPGARKVSEIMAIIAQELNLTLENNGVEATLTDQYLSGTPIQKLQRVAAAARIQYWYLPEEGVIAIAPMGAPRDTYPPVTYSIKTGLVSWPMKRHVGIAFTALFNPNTYHGCKILMESTIPSCSGNWYIVSMTHRLDGNVPGGAWFSDFVATPENAFILTR
jgi:hypothetical protein